MFQAELVGRSKHIFYAQQLFFPLKNRTVYEVTWKNIVELGMPQMAIQ